MPMTMGLRGLGLIRRNRTGSAVFSISGTPVTAVTKDFAYDGFTVTASSGIAPYTYSLQGSWPTGASIDSSTGVVSGTITGAAADYASLSVRATDSTPGTPQTVDLATFTLTVRAPTVVFLTAGTTTWQVPAGRTKIKGECLGSGGNSRSTNRSGGAGGAYSMDIFATTPLEMLDVQIPTSTPAIVGSASVDCFIKQGGVTKVLAKSAECPAGTSAQAQGGLASAGTGSVKFSGGNAGATSGGSGRSGGGGAAGPSGNGAVGGAIVASSTIHAGGGGANGGGAGVAGGTVAGTDGNGGTGPGGAAGGTSTATTGNAGTNGSGGGGAGTGGGGANSHNAEWDATHGCGSGGGAVNSTNQLGGSGSSTGSYGGGSGGTIFSGQIVGGSGLIVITH
jgi:hypothetical protein